MGAQAAGPTGDPATQLAVALCIAVRIEPELIRAVRLEVLPSLDVSAEADLWFSDDLVAARGSDSIMLQRELLPQLRGELAAWLAASDRADPVRGLWDITARVHASTSPTLLLEERVAWHAARQRLAALEGEDVAPAIEDELRTALTALVRESRTGVADWLVGAWPRLPPAVRETKTAWLLRQAASMSADVSGLSPTVTPSGIDLADVTDLASLVEPAGDVRVPVRLADGVLEIGDIGPLAGAAAVPLLDTDPRIVAVLPDDESTAGTTIAIPKGSRLSLPVGPGPARLLTPRGQVYRATPYVPPRMLVPLPGSQRAQLPSALETGVLDPTTTITVTLVLRRRRPMPDELLSSRYHVTAQELAAQYGADPDDVQAVRQVLAGFGLSVGDVHTGARLVSVTAPAAMLTSIFGTYLTWVRSDDPGGGDPVVHRYRTGGLSIPADLDGIVTAVLGLDDRPQAVSCVRGPLPGDSGQPLSPPDAAMSYEFPAGPDGAGERVALIDLGAGVVSDNALAEVFAYMGIRPPAVTWIGPLPATALPVGDPDTVYAAMAVAGSLAPGADYTVYFAPNTDQGLLEFLSRAVHASPAPTVICVGWGAAEDLWTAQARAAINAALVDAAALGITVCVAAGDGGSGSGYLDQQSRVYFPASSPHALACGGTTMRAGSRTGWIDSEVVWQYTGGGISDVFPTPSWQAEAAMQSYHSEGYGTGRGVPDVAANADPATGYQVVFGKRGRVFGGTALAAALWAALICRLAQATGRRWGLLQPLIYAGVTAGVDAPGFTSITEGNNGAYRAGPGWDPCTGLGTPRGTQLLSLLTESPSY